MFPWKKIYMVYGEQQEQRLILDNFQLTVSFLFKISETIAENKRVDAIHPIPVTNENSLPASMCTTIFLITWVLQLWLAGKTRRK